MPQRLTHVAVGVVRDAEDRVLLTQRPARVHLGGLWEFPGGKAEPGETVLSALCRELGEEIGIEVHRARPLIRIVHHYPERSVLLDTWIVQAHSGTAKGCEGQPLAWVSVRDLVSYALPAADAPIVTALTLPELWRVTDPGILDLGQGLRQPADVQPCSLTPPAQPERRMRGAICCGLAAFATLGGDLDFAVLGPVGSEPGSSGLGWTRFRDAVDGVNFPVYAWGPRGQTDLSLAWHHGAQGVALPASAGAFDS